jgi:tripartite-type tricarboxylate transporter receptor subunit TctC
MLPDIPTMEEAGVKGYEVYEWNPVVAPIGINADTKKQLAAAIDHAMKSPEVLERIKALGGEPFGGGPAAAEQFLKEQEALWTRIVREHNIKVD